MNVTEAMYAIDEPVMVAALERADYVMDEMDVIVELVVVAALEGAKDVMGAIVEQVLVAAVNGMEVMKVSVRLAVVAASGVAVIAKTIVGLWTITWGAVRANQGSILTGGWCRRRQTTTWMTSCGGQLKAKRRRWRRLSRTQ